MLPQKKNFIIKSQNLSNLKIPMNNWVVNQSSPNGQLFPIITVA